MKYFFFLFFSLCSSVSYAQALGEQVKVHDLLWDVHEMSVAQVRQFANATGFVSLAEQEGGGYVYESGWVQKKGWSWHQPFGVPAQDDEPAVHLTFDEAQSICRFFGKRLPTNTI